MTSPANASLAGRAQPASQAVPVPTSRQVSVLQDTNLGRKTGFKPYGAERGLPGPKEPMCFSSDDKSPDRSQAQHQSTGSGEQPLVCVGPVSASCGWAGWVPSAMGLDPDSSSRQSGEVCSPQGDKALLSLLSAAAPMYLRSKKRGELTGHQTSPPMAAKPKMSLHLCPRIPAAIQNRNTPTREIKRLVHHELLSKADVAEILLALPNGDDLPALLKHLHDDLLRAVLWQPPNKHRLTARGSLSCRWRGKI